MQIVDAIKARLHERFFAYHLSKIGDNSVMPSSWSVDSAAHAVHQVNTLLMLQFRLSKQLGNWFTDRVGNWLR